MAEIKNQWLDCEKDPEGKPSGSFYYTNEK